MTIAADLRNYLSNPLGEWKKLSGKPQDHLGPLTVLGAATFLVIAISERRFAGGFVVVSCMIYPFYHRQIVYFMSFDLHENVRAVSITAIYVLAIKYPPLAVWGLPPFLAIVYSYRSNWTQLHSSLDRQSANLDTSEQSNKALRELTDSFAEQVSILVQLYDDLVKAEHASSALSTPLQQAVEASQLTTADVNARCKNALGLLSAFRGILEAAKKTDAGTLLQKIDAHYQTLHALRKQIELQRAENERLGATNDKYQRFIDEGIRREKEFQEQLR